MAAAAGHDQQRGGVREVRAGVDLNAVTGYAPASAVTWRDGDAWLGGGSWLFSQPQPRLRRLLDLNLAYLYGDQTFKALDAGNMAQARAAAQKALIYSPNSFGSTMRLAFLSYLVRDKQASLDEFAKAKALNPADFDKQWKEDVKFDRFKPMAADKEFLEKLFPNGAPQ